MGKEELLRLEWVTLKQAAVILDLAPKTVYKVLQERRGPQCEKYLGRLRFRPAELMAWRKHNTTIRRAFT